MIQHTKMIMELNINYTTKTVNVYSKYEEWEVDHLKGKDDIEPDQLEVVTHLQNEERNKT